MAQSTCGEISRTVCVVILILLILLPSRTEAVLPTSIPSFCSSSAFCTMLWRVTHEQFNFIIILLCIIIISVPLVIYGCCCIRHISNTVFRNGRLRQKNSKGSLRTLLPETV